MNSSFAISIGLYFSFFRSFSSSLSKKGAPIEICNALLPIILAFSYFEKPILLFGVAGFFFLAAAFAIGLYLLLEFFRGALNPDRPLMTVLILLIIGGLQFVSLGLVGTQIVQLRKEVYRIQMENRRLERAISDERR